MEEKYPLMDGFIRFVCKCGYYVDFKRKDLRFYKIAFNGMVCPQCDRTFKRWD